MKRAAQKAVIESLTRPQALELAERLTRAVSAHDVSALMAMYADDATVVSPAMSEIRGQHAIAESWKNIFTSFPDWRVELTDVLADGNRLAIMGFCRATDRNGWFGLPATGAQFGYRAVVLLTFDGGKIVRDERVYDISALLQNLEKSRLDRELKTAADVQHALLSRIPRMGGHYEVAGDSYASRTISGDFFEYFDLPSGDFAVVFGDVAGKGPAAAILASMLQGIFAVEAPRASGPSAALTLANGALLRHRLETQFATVVYAVLSADGRLTYSNAGHNAPMVMTGGKMKRLEAGGPILGAFTEVKYTEESLQLKAGDSILMFTDGVTEAPDRAGEEFGENRLLSVFRSHAGLKPADLVVRILAAAQHHSQGVEQSDDMTVVAIRFRGV